MKPRIKVKTNPYHGVKFYYVVDDELEVLIAVKGTAVSQPRLTHTGELILAQKYNQCRVL